MILTNKQKSFLDKVVYGLWSINPNTDLIDVDGCVDISSMGLTEIPFDFGDVTGNFNCGNNLLVNLNGSPRSSMNFYCDYNLLETLSGGPKLVSFDYYCYNNKLSSLEGSPQLVGGDFYCFDNNLNILNGAPQSVGGKFYIQLKKIDRKYHSIIIPQIEEMIERGIKLYRPEEYYYPYKEIYYNSKLIEIL
jgi:hypothetical protein